MAIAISIYKIHSADKFVRIVIHGFVDAELRHCRNPKTCQMCRQEIMKKERYVKIHTNETILNSQSEAIHNICVGCCDWKTKEELEDIPPYELNEYFETLNPPI